MKMLKDEDVPSNVFKIANIIRNHLDEVIPLGTAAGRRLKLIVELAQEEFENASSECLVGTESTPATMNGISKLKSMTVGPFRGFVNAETFDLDGQVVLIYGPNGTGKSSFCEALEYGLLGSVNEAENGRFRDERDYLANAHVNRFEMPIIKGTIEGVAEPLIVNASENEFRFCFIEKNRIDNFSRIAAQSPARQTELISTLFGLDCFNDFVRGFSLEIGNYIDLQGIKARKLEEKRKVLANNEQTIVSNNQELEQITENERVFADNYQKGMTYKDFVAELGTEEKPGLIKHLKTELQKATPQLIGLKKTNLISVRKALEKTIIGLQTKENELAGYKDELSYKSLYQAVIALTETSNENCPACKTPLEQATENPFVIAEDGLSKLKHISILETELDVLKKSLDMGFRDVYKFLLNACQLKTTEGLSEPLKHFLIADDDVSMLNAEWWEELIKLDLQGDSAWRQLLQVVDVIEKNDLDAIQDKAKREVNATRLEELQQLHSQVIRFQTRREVLNEGIAKSTELICTFNESNKELIEAVKLEEVAVAQNKEIVDSYSTFVQLLNRYKDSLPVELVEDLGERAVLLYNSFNRNDSQNELLASLKLPVLSGDRISISFKDEPDKYFDALKILSEGHIRCIGLAILLAKNLNENSPFVIFDDPVNAIDDDHRESIRKTLFEDDYFKDKQIILTCHGEEFYKDIQNLLGAERTSIANRYTFLPKRGDKHLRIDFNSAPRNYVLAAQEHITKLETRNALEKSRQALESLTKGKIWRYVSKHGDGNLSIKLRAYNSPIELRNLTEQLKSKISKQDFIHADKDAVLGALSKLLGINGGSREWRYMNKGTHEESDRAEFDRGVVEEIVNCLVVLDSTL